MSNGAQSIPKLAELPAPESAESAMTSGIPREQRESLARFAKASTPRALWQLANTLLPFVALWACMAWTLLAEVSYLWTLLLAPPTAALYVRLFILQHDCSHGSFFASSRANRWLGASLGLLTLFPFAYWKKTHGVHHATSGNLDQRELGDIRTLTVERIPRQLTLDALLLPLLPQHARDARHRAVLPVRRQAPVSARHALELEEGMAQRGAQQSRAARARRRLCASGSAGACAGGAPAGGGDRGRARRLAVLRAAQLRGKLLGTPQRVGSERRGGRRQLVLRPAAVLRWITGNIGYHHIHHLAPRIPNYHLRAAHEAVPSLKPTVRMGLRESLACARMKLWDESLGRMVGFPRPAARRS